MIGRQSGLIKKIGKLPIKAVNLNTWTTFYHYVLEWAWILTVFESMTGVFVLQSFTQKKS